MVLLNSGEVPFWFVNEDVGNTEEVRSSDVAEEYVEDVVVMVIKSVGK